MYHVLSFLCAGQLCCISNRLYDRKVMPVSLPHGMQGLILGMYLHRPAGVLVVPGPGLIHALAGMANAAVNCW